MVSTKEKKLRRSHAILNGEAETPAPAVESNRVATNSEAETATDQAAEGETGGPKGPEPTRFGDWERKGRCIDF